MSTASDLIEARARIDTPEKWRAGWLAGGGSPYTTDQAVSCAVGADPDQVIAMCAALDRAVPDEFTLDEYSALRPYIQYLDRHAPTHADILALFDRAITASQQSEKQHVSL